MEYYVKSVVPIIESNYDNFTTVEKNIADYFIQNHKKMDFSAKAVAERLRHLYPDLPRNADTEATGSSYISMRRPL